MATTATTKKTSSAKSAKKPAKPETAVIDVTAEAAENNVTPVHDKTVSRKPAVATEVNIHEYIPVRNGAHGTLVYISPRTHETYVWDEFGDEQEMELQELKNAKSASKKFFINNWFMFDDEHRWVIDYLGVGQFYKHMIDIDNYDEFFRKSPDEISDALNEMSDGQKKSIARRAKQLVGEGEIDSNKVIAVLEKGLGVELIER